MKKIAHPVVLAFFTLCFICGCASTGVGKGIARRQNKNYTATSTKKTVVVSQSDESSRNPNTNNNISVNVYDKKVVEKETVTSNDPHRIVRIGLLVNVASFNLSGGGYIITSLSSPLEKKQMVGRSDDFFVSVDRASSKVIIDGKSYTPPLRILPYSEDGEGENFIRINGKSYRGLIEVTVGRKGDQRMTVINEVEIEDYLKGVLPSEMNPAWPLEALKSQAVAARSFAWKNLGRHQKEGFDLCSTVHCQVYTGVVSESEQTTRAVEETRGEILIDPSSGETANAVFHACCGGYTEDPSNVWDIGGSGKSPSYLAPRRCPYCKDYPHFNWSSVLDADFIKERLSQNGWKVGNIKKIEIAGRNVSGRVRFFRVIHNKGVTVIPGGKFRLAVDAWKIKSTRISAVVRRGDKSFEFRGQGWGHGVGMCQAGARGMAESGKDYREILGFYYKGAVVGNISQSK